MESPVHPASQPPKNLNSDPELRAVEPFRTEVLAWHGQGVHVTTIRQALARIHGFAGNVHNGYRFLQQAATEQPLTSGCRETTPGRFRPVTLVWLVIHTPSDAAPPRPAVG